MDLKEGKQCVHKYIVKEGCILSTSFMNGYPCVYKHAGSRTGSFFVNGSLFPFPLACLFSLHPLSTSLTCLPSTLHTLSP